MNHTKIYCKFFELGEQDWQRSELSGQHASGGIHHLKYRSMGGTNVLMNLIALTHSEHEKAHTGEYTVEDLRCHHDNFVIRYIQQNPHKLNELDEESKLYYADLATPS